MRIRRSLPRESNEPQLAFSVSEETASAKALQLRRTTLTLSTRDGRPKVSKTYRRLTSVLGTDCSNAEVYKRALSPLVARVLSGETACCFAYGHTGSGKTHTIVGYGTELGLYRHAGHALTSAIADTSLQLQIRCAELYQGKVYDLLSDRAECFLREDSAGQVHIRSATQMDPNGCVRVQSLRAAYARRIEDVDALVERALSSRAVGNSSLHSQSSRSHALIELQLVTPAVISARVALLDAEASLVPIGKARDGKFINISSRCFTPDPDRKGAWIENKNAVPECEHEELAQLQIDEVLQHAREQEQVAVREASALSRKAGNVMGEADDGVSGQWECGTLVLVDLAGAEYSNLDVKHGVRSSQESSEGREINSSLPSLKECMRSLSRGAAHVPFRNSKLTLLLRRYLRAEASSAVMLATVAPTISQSAATQNTLQYASLLADTNA